MLGCLRFSAEVVIRLMAVISPLPQVLASGLAVIGEVYGDLDGESEDIQVSI